MKILIVGGTSNIGYLLAKKLYYRGHKIYIEVIIVYGYNLVEAMKDFKLKAIKEIERLTAMNVTQIDVLAKGIQMPEEN